jgi:uncharacterized membrane protein
MATARGNAVLRDARIGRRSSRRLRRIHWVIVTVTSRAAVGSSMQLFPITSDAGILAVLCGVCGFFYWLERVTKWRFFSIVPPLVFIYLVPVVFTNAGVLPAKSAVYDKIGELVLPVMLLLMLLNVDVGGAFRLMGRGVIVMLAGSLGVVVGAGVGMFVVQEWVGSTAWKSFGALSGSWVGGTGNLAAVAGALNATDGDAALAILADTSLLLVWLPIMLASKRFAERFQRFAKVDPQRVARMEEAAKAAAKTAQPATYRDYLYLLSLALLVTWISQEAAARLPVYEPYVTKSSWLVLLVTTLGIGLALTPLRHIPASRELGMALILLFMARIGATADLSGVADQALPFLAGAAICIAIHGLFCITAAWLLRVDIHTAAIASAANIGGTATATVVAAHHREALVPAGIMMALIGYALGNYAGYLAGLLCAYISGN